VDSERLGYWLGHGAQVSERVGKLIKDSAQSA
jgi:ribosomal protein S16